MTEEMMDQETIIDALIEVLNGYRNGVSTFANQGQAMDGLSALANFIALVEMLKTVRGTK